MRPKFKVLKLDISFDLGLWINLDMNLDKKHYKNLNKLTPEQCLELHRKEFAEGKTNYNGIFNFIEECSNPGFPEREGLQYLIRVTKQEKEEDGTKKDEGYWKSYHCYYFQLGRWWKYIKPKTIFTDICVPQIMNHYDYLKYKKSRLSLKFLSEKSLRDYKYFSQLDNLNEIGRNVQRNRLRAAKLLGKKYFYGKSKKSP